MHMIQTQFMIMFFIFYCPSAGTSVEGGDSPTPPSAAAVEDATVGARALRGRLGGRLPPTWPTGWVDGGRDTTPGAGAGAGVGVTAMGNAGGTTPVPSVGGTPDRLPRRLPAPVATFMAMAVAVGARPDKVLAALGRNDVVTLGGAGAGTGGAWAGTRATGE